MNGLIEMLRLPIVQHECVFACIAMAEYGLAPAEMLRKHIKNTETYHHISGHRITKDI